MVTGDVANSEWSLLIADMDTYVSKRLPARPAPAKALRIGLVTVTPPSSSSTWPIPTRSQQRALTGSTSRTAGSSMSTIFRRYDRRPSPRMRAPGRPVSFEHCLRPSGPAQRRPSLFSRTRRCRRHRAEDHRLGPMRISSRQRARILRPLAARNVLLAPEVFELAFPLPTRIRACGATRKGGRSRGAVGVPADDVLALEKLDLALSSTSRKRPGAD